jgi:hypothetical protein
MNTNLFQTILTVLITISGVVSSILVGLGCKADAVSGALNCDTASVSTQFLPWLAGVASILGIVKLLLAAFEGKLTSPTIPVKK